MKDFAKTVATQRKKKKMTQEELAMHLGITPQAVSKWENGIGLPDVTMFPRLAEVLGISIETLFGVEKETRSERIPLHYEGLSYIAEIKGRLCYSNKNVTEKTDEKIVFADGSFADMTNGVVTNCGSGEIRVFDDLEWKEGDSYAGGEMISEELPLQAFDSLTLMLSRKCNVKIIPVHLGEQRIYIHGNENLVKRLKHEIVGERLSVELGDSTGYRSNSDFSDPYVLKIYVPFKKGRSVSAVLNGSGSVEIGVAFEDGELSTNGCGDITATDFERLCIRINGSGNFTGGSVIQSVKLRIAGSGDMTFSHVANPDIKISGSGDITAESAEGDTVAQISGSGALQIGSVRGNMSARVSGSADFSCHGELDMLKIRISGSGSFAGERLTVREADLCIQGSGDIALERIKEKSVEKLSKNALLKVGYRG